MAKGHEERQTDITSYIERKNMSSTIDLVSGLESQMASAAKAQKRVDRLTAQIEKLEGKRAEIVGRFGAIATPARRGPGRPAGSKNKASAKAASGKGKRGRAPNGLIVPFMLKHVSNDKASPTTLADLVESHGKLKNAITQAKRPGVIFMQALKGNGKLFKKIAHGKYVLTAAGVNAKDGSKVEKPVKAKAKAPKTAPAATDAPAASTPAA